MRSLHITTNLSADLSRPTLRTNLPSICTYKVALRAWPDAPRHTNQVLRYWRELVIDRTFAMPPHRAGPDAWVTAHLLVELSKTVSIADMISWTGQPAQYASVPFGRYRGKRWSDVPSEYLDWIIQHSHLNEEIKQSAGRELKLRKPS